MTMACGSGNSVFHNLLVEEYKKKPKNIDVVAQKKKNFQTLLFRGHDELRSKNFTEAKKTYLTIIEFLKNDPYPDELNLSPDLYYCVQCCFCYSCLMDSHSDTKCNKITADLVLELSEKYSNKLFPKFLQVLLQFRKRNWVMTLRWCHAVDSHAEDLEDQYISVDITEAILPKGPQIVAEVEMYEEKSFFNHWARLARNRLARSKNEKYQFLSKEVNIIMKLLNMETPFAELDLQQVFVQDVIPLWFTSKGNTINLNPAQKNITQCGDCVKAIMKSSIIRAEGESKTKVKFEMFLVKFVEAFTKIYECGFIDSIQDCVLSKIDEIEKLVTHGSSMNKIKDVSNIDTNRITAQTQTEKIKTGNKCVQTEIMKTKNVEIQVNSDLQLMNTVLDIKSKLLVNQEKKNETITKLNKKVCELNDKLSKETAKRKYTEEDYQKKFSKQEAELKKLRDQLIECKKTRKQESEKNVSLQKLLVEQITEKFNTHKGIYKSFEKKSAFMVTYLKEISQFLTPSSIPNEALVKQNIDLWETHLKKIKVDLDHLSTFYNKARTDMINSGNFNLTWPEVPDFPGDEDNIVFLSFKPAIKNIVEIEDKFLKKSNATPSPHQNTHQNTPMTQNISYGIPRHQYPVQSSAYFIGPRLVYPSLPQALPVTTASLPQHYPAVTRERIPYECHMQHQQAFVDQTTWQNQNLLASRSTECLNRHPGRDVRVTEIVESCKSNVKATSVNGCSEKEDKKYQEKEQILFEYVAENCPGISEEDITFALLQVMEDNKGTLSKLPKEKIVDDVKTVLRVKKQSAWVTPKSPHVDWKNDHSERDCSICFEEFHLKDTYTLPCQHEYHKECIKKWLKTSSVCPICRVHSVIDEEFPPLH